MVSGKPADLVCACSAPQISSCPEWIVTDYGTVDKSCRFDPRSKRYGNACLLAYARAGLSFSSSGFPYSLDPAKLVLCTILKKLEVKRRIANWPVRA